MDKNIENAAKVKAYLDSESRALYEEMHTQESGPNRAYSELSTKITDFFKDLKAQGMPEDFTFTLTSMYANALMMTRIVT